MFCQNMVCLGPRTSVRISIHPPQTGVDYGYMPTTTLLWDYCLAKEILYISASVRKEAFADYSSGIDLSSRRRSNDSLLQVQLRFNQHTSCRQELILTMPLYASVYIAPPIQITIKGKPAGPWSPIASTLLHTTKNAVLIDTPITIQQNNELIAWIEKTLHPGCKLSYVYITHGHGDHWFGINALLRHFPGVQVVATMGTVEYMKKQASPKVFESSWASRFPGQIDTNFSVDKVQALPSSVEFSIPNEDGTGKHVMRAVEVGHSDTHDSTVLFCPDLALVAAGDVVYGDVHQMLAEANTHDLRMEWVRAIETVQRLKPTPQIVVPGHMKVNEVPGAWHLERSKRYILDFDKAVSSGRYASTKALVKAQTEKWPTRFNDAVVVMGAMSAMKMAKDQGKGQGKL
jgi:glyoxylase-like metal-dependent hydrolase (beta-lactamase superfamily II)